MINEQQNMSLNLTFMAYQDVVIKYIKKGITPQDVSIEKLLKHTHLLTPIQKDELHGKIDWILPKTQDGESAIRINEWLQFFSNPFTGRQENCLDNVKKRANEFLPLLPYLSTEQAFDTDTFVPIGYQGNM